LELRGVIQEYYRQMRKFGCNILAVVQQYDIIKDSAVRGAMIGNSKMLSTVEFSALLEHRTSFICVPTIILLLFGDFRAFAPIVGDGADRIEKA
jgi:hypothetical protein